MNKLAWLGIVFISCAGHQRNGSTAQSQSERNKPAFAVLGKEGNIALTTLDGKQVKLADYGARATVIALWATYCEPCMEELPKLEELYQKYRGDKDVSILAVSTDEIEESEQLDRVKQTVRKLGLTMPVLLDKSRALQRRFSSEVPAGPLPDGFKIPRPGEKFSMTLPMVVTVDSQFKIHRTTGFTTEDGKDSFVSDKAALIELARVNNLPAEAPPKKFEPGSGSSKKLKFKLPPMTAAEFQKFWPEFQASEQKQMQLNDASMARLKKEIEAQLGSGKPIAVELQLEATPALAR